MRSAPGLSNTTLLRYSAGKFLRLSCGSRRMAVRLPLSSKQWSSCSAVSRTLETPKPNPKVACSRSEKNVKPSWWSTRENRPATSSASSK